MLSLGSPSVDRVVAPLAIARARLHQRLHSDPDGLAELTGITQRMFLDWVAKTDAVGPGGRPEQISDLPLTSKQQLKDRVDAFARDKQRSHFFVGSTSGSSGFKTEMWFEHNYFVCHFSRLLWLFGQQGVAPTADATAILDLCHHAWEGNAFVMPVLNDAHYRGLSIHASRWPSTHDMLAAITALGPLVIHAVPSCIEMLAHAYAEHPDLPRPRPRCIRTVAEPLLDHTRQLVAGVFDCPVLSGYGLTEVGGVVAEECGRGSGFHVNPLDFHVEVVDPTGRPVADGVTGEIVITNLYNRTVPIARYRTNDFGSLTHERCACGALGPRIQELAGRQISLFTLPDGTSFNPYFEFNLFFRSFPCQQFQLVQEGAREIRLAYVASEDLNRLPELDLFVASLRQKYGEALSFQATRVAEFSFERKLHCFLNKTAIQSS